MKRFKTKKRSKSLQILVTGGTGFIGTHLVNQLVRRYDAPLIDIVDDLSSSFLSKARRDFFKSRTINFYKTKVEDFTPPKNRSYDFIFHLASPVGPAGVLKYAGSMGAMIVTDAVKMAHLAIKNKSKLLCVSTSEVYGSHPEGDTPQQEDIPKIVPSKVTVRLEYGVSKLLMEIVLLNLSKVTPLHVNFIRPFNIVGPCQNGVAGFVVPRLIRAALDGSPLTVFGDGKQKRTFTHVADIVAPMIDLMESKHRDNIYNVGNAENLCSILELAKRIIKLSNSKSKIKHVDPKKIYGKLYEEAWNKIPNTDRVTKDLYWKPKFSLNQTLAECIDFEKGNLDFTNPDIIKKALKSG